MAKDDIGGKWRTIGGRRVFIKDGQDLASAMKESGKFKKRIKNFEEKEHSGKIEHEDEIMSIDDYKKEYGNDAKKLRDELSQSERFLDEDSEGYEEAKKSIENGYKYLDQLEKQKEPAHNVGEAEAYYSKMKDEDIAKDLAERKNRLDNGYYDKKDEAKYRGFYEEGKKFYQDKQETNLKSEMKQTQYEKIKNAKDQYAKDIYNAKDFKELKEIANRVEDKTTRDNLNRRLENLKAYNYDKSDIVYAKDYLIDDYNKIQKGEYTKLGNKFDYKKDSDSNKQINEKIKSDYETKKKYSQKQLDNVWKTQDATELYDYLTNSEKRKLAQAHDDASFGNQSAKDYIKKMDNEVATRFLNRRKK